MDENSVLRYHALYQKSWTGNPRDPVRTPRDITSSPGSQSKTPRVKTSSRSTRSDLGSLELKKGGLRLNERGPAQNSQQQNKEIKPKRTASKSPMPTLRVASDPLSDRRTQRSTRRRPWSEKVPKAPARSDEFEMVYEASLPKDESAEYKARKYVTNPRYGQLYEVKREKPRPTPHEEPDSHWLWEDKFRLWCLEMDTPRRHTRAGLQKSSRVSEVSRNEVMSSRTAKTPDLYRPHADLFAAYHNQKLLNQRRDLAAIVVQRHVRGFLVRKHIKDMKRQALLGLGRAWPKITKEYRELLTRVQVRQGVDKPSNPFSLRAMQDYLDKREKYERAFDKVAPDNKLSRDQLTEFLQECGHFPTEGETTAAFNTVFKGSGSTAEVVFVLDCSSSVGDRNFRDLMTFVKDVVRALPVGKDRVRVGLVPYNTDVFQSFGLRQHSTTEEILHAIDQIQFRPGLTRTDLALRIMMNVFQDSRPGVQKVAVVVTDGQSAHVQRTALEAKRAADSNITLFAVGVGENVQREELESIARDTTRVLMCSSYHALIQLKQFVSSKLCLRACTLCQYILPRVQLHGLYKAEAVEIAFTLYKPTALCLLPHAPSTNSASFGQPTTTPDGIPSSRTHQIFPSRRESFEDDRRVIEQSSEIPSAVSINTDTKPDQEATADVAKYASKKEDMEKSARSASGLEKADREVGSTSSGSGEEKSTGLSAVMGGFRETPQDCLAESASGNGGKGDVVTLDTGSSLRYIKEAAENSGTGNSPPTSASVSQASGRSRTAVISSTSASDVSQAAARSRMVTASGAITSHSSLSDSSLANVLALTDETRSTPPFNQGDDSVTSTNHPAGSESTTISREHFPPTSSNASEGTVGARSTQNSGEDSATSQARCSSEPGKTSSSVQDNSATPQMHANLNGNNSSANVGPSSAQKVGSRDSDRSRSCVRGSVQDVCRPLTRSEALEVVWTLQPLPATGLNRPISRWIRPLVDGEPAWGLLDENIIKATDFKVCLGLVVKSRLEREGVISIPSDVRAGVEEVTTYEEAMQKIEAYLAQRKAVGDGAQ